MPAVQQQDTAARRPVAPLLTGLGGVVVLVGSLLPWHAVTVEPSFLRFISVSFTQSVAGTQGIDGKVAIACGVVLIAAAVAMFLAPAPRVLKIVAGVAVAAAVISAALIVADLVGGERAFASFFRNSVRNFAQDRLHITPSDSQLDSLRETLGMTLSLRIGIFVALAGNVVGAIGGVVGLTTRAPAPTAPTAPPAY